MRIIVSGLAAFGLLAAAAAPADARHRRHYDDDIDAGDVLAGAAVVGGIALLASALGDGKRRKQDMAVDACSAEAESRVGGRVSDIFSVDRRKGYYTVEGAVDGESGRGNSFTCTIRNGIVYSFRYDVR
jgi:hypothetical protein